MRANVRHRRLITKLGRAPVLAAFRDAVVCLVAWSRWPVVLRAPDIAERWTHLGITEEMRPNTPREVAAWYPNAVALAALILSQVREVDLAGGMTLDIAARGVERLRAEVIGGLIPGGAWNPTDEP